MDSKSKLASTYKEYLKRKKVFKLMTVVPLSIALFLAFLCGKLGGRLESVDPDSIYHLRLLMTICLFMFVCAVHCVLVVFFVINGWTLDLKDKLLQILIEDHCVDVAPVTDRLGGQSGNDNCL